MSEPGVSFEHDEETRMIVDNLERFIEQEVKPIQEELGETYENPRLRHETDGRLVPEVVEAIQEVRRRSAEAGYYAMNLPEDVGGGGVSNVTWYEAKKAVAASGVEMAEHVLAGPEGPKPLLLLAEGEQIERYLEPAVRAEKSTAFAQTEPGVGSDSPNMSTTAEKDGDEWVIDGRKQWITNGPYADFVQVFARTTPQEEAGRYGGITCFIVEADEYEVSSLNNAVGAEGMQAELVFDGVRVPEERVLGEVDGAFYQAMDFLSLGRLELGAEAIGYAEYLLERGVEYATDREAFGRPIGKFQQISSKLAEGRAKTYAADAAGLRCAWKMDQGESVVEDASILKYYGTNVFWDVVDDVVQIHGGNGLSEDNPFMRHLHMARILRIVEGTDEIQLNTIASEFAGI
ncbi:acyl-CoA dehydrogenase [Halovenus sp. WSH3]|uniref:Acyl-CoA dehydrogenase n=1 Tax=Halovenus carboxidivorans TaxID=2692199 RepID=A0A6B0T1L8_9EURY|nr:acyl-CoA dehydrogenase family protein [Halovenus carboxidivorans]MXR51057.1 acyl-CoA dehydrogenase [Halovenus carboxidivorans]